MRYIKNYSKFNEALKPSQFIKYVNAFDKERYADIFKQIGDDYQHDRNYYRVYIPLEKERQVGYISDVQEMVDKFLNDNGLEIVDYVEGTAKYKSDTTSIRRNDEITNSQVRLVGANVNQGLYSFEDALNIAKEMNLDLVETSVKGNQSICQVIDYNKYIQDKSKEVRTVKIGQILQRLKNDKLGLAFTSDEKRKVLTSTEREDLMVVISRHPYDIAGSDTDRDWTNCMTIGTSKSNRLTLLMNELEDAKKSGDLDKINKLKEKIKGYKKDGENVEYLIHEVKEGSLISYLIKSSDRNIESPIGVLNIKPFIGNKGEISLFSSAEMYGIQRPEFKKTVDNILNKYFNISSSSSYFRVNKKVHPDELYNIAFLDRMTIKEKCDYYFINNYKINSDDTVDVDGDVWLNGKELTEIPIKFGKVSGKFNCNGNKLTSLEGSPKEVGDIFQCDQNKLTSLKGCPKTAKGFYCNNNQLTSLEGCPNEVLGPFFCRNNQLTSLEGGPKKVTGVYHCSNNQLTSLQGCPKEVYDFNCSNNQLTSLEGGPERLVGKYSPVFNCTNNPLESLEGAPSGVR